LLKYTRKTLRFDGSHREIGNFVVDETAFDVREKHIRNTCIEIRNGTS